MGRATRQGLPWPTRQMHEGKQFRRVRIRELRRGCHTGTGATSAIKCLRNTERQECSLVNIRSPGGVRTRREAPTLRSACGEADEILFCAAAAILAGVILYYWLRPNAQSKSTEPVVASRNSLFVFANLFAFTMRVPHQPAQYRWRTRLGLTDESALVLNVLGSKLLTCIFFQAQVSSLRAMTLRYSTVTLFGSRTRSFKAQRACNLCQRRASIAPQQEHGMGLGIAR